MRFTLLATLALVGVAIASPAPADQDKKLPSGAPCTKDGKMGVCESGLCKQIEGQPQGECK